MDIPTKEQQNKIQELQKDGYRWDQHLSISFCAVVLKKEEDLCIFDLEGRIDLHRKLDEFIFIELQERSKAN